MRWTLAVIATVAAALLLARRAQAAQAEPWAGVSVPDLSWLDVGRGPTEVEAGQLPGAIESAIVAVSPSTWIDAPMDDQTKARNLRAFLDTIAFAEGTSGANGYRTMFGGALFDDFSDHPRRAVQFTDKAGRRLWTSAAGRYQFMAVSPIPGGRSTRVDTWDRLKRSLNLPDFSPASQDAAAVELIRQRGALNDVYAGRLVEAVAKVAKVWASLPGAGYDQPERKLASLVTAYQAAGGTTEA